MSRLFHPAKSLILAMALLAAVAVNVRGEVPLPEKAISEDVVAVVYVDLVQLTPEALTASLDAVKTALPEGLQQELDDNRQEIEDRLEERAEGRDKFVDAGGQGVLIGVIGDGDFETRQAFALIKVKPGTDPEALAQTLKEISPRQDAQVQLSAYADGWLAVAGGDPRNPLVAPPTEGSPEAVADFRRTLAGRDAVAKAAMRMTPGLQAAIDKAIEQNAEANPIARDIATALKGMATGQSILALGERPGLTQTLTFTEASGAGDFAKAFNALLDTGRDQLQARVNTMKGRGMDIGVSDQQITAVLQPLRPKVDGRTVTLTLDTALADPLKPIIAELQKLRNRRR